MRTLAFDDIVGLISLALQTKGDFMAALGRDESISLYCLGARYLEKHDLRLGFRVFGLKGTSRTC